MSSFMSTKPENMPVMRYLSECLSADAGMARIFKIIASSDELL